MTEVWVLGADLLQMVIWLTPAGTMDDGGLKQPAYLNFELSLLGPPSGNEMRVRLSDLLCCAMQPVPGIVTTTPAWGPPSSLAELLSNPCTPSSSTGVMLSRCGSHSEGLWWLVRLLHARDGWHV